MALVVEDGTGKTDAESYCSVADADSYLALNYVSTNTSLVAWNAAATATKEIALRTATQYLDIHFDGSWRGYKFSTTQALAWPRSSAADNEDHYFDSDEIPARLQNAVAELALRIVSGDTLLADQSSPGDIKSKRVKAGPIEREIEYVGGLSAVKKYPKVEDLLKSLITLSAMVERG